MHEPLVVCVTPTYGRPHLLKEMLWCWVQQTHKNKRLIILNDQPNVELKCDVDGVTIINHPTRFSALGEKRNYLNSLIPCDAEFVFPMDDDDLFLTNHIERLVTALRANPDYDRSKNSINYVAVNNQFHSVDRINNFYGASCFRAPVYLNTTMNPTYVMGEDTDMLERYNIRTFNIEDNISTFIYRLGMGIVHASGHGGHLVHEPTAQANIHKMIEDNTQQYDKSISIDIVPELGFAATQLLIEIRSLAWKNF